MYILNIDTFYSFDTFLHLYVKSLHLGKKFKMQKGKTRKLL